MTDRRGRRSRLRRCLILLLAGVLLLGACSEEAYVPAGIIRTPAPDVSDVLLPDVTNGRDVPAVAPEDGLLILYFGYTSCPDVCPTSMAVVRRAIRDLGDDGERIAVAVVTVDPERDTPEVLTAYVRAFSDDGFAVRTTDPDRLDELADAFGVTYSVTTADDGFVEVVHTGFLYAVDDRGVLRLTWPFGIDSDSVFLDMQALLKEYDDA